MQTDMTFFNMATTVTLVLFAAVAFTSIILKRPKYMVYFYMIMIFFFTSSTIGLRELVSTLYDRGTGILPISLLNTCLIAMFLFFFAIRLFQPRLSKTTQSFNIETPSLLFVLYFIAYSLWGLLASIELDEVLSRRGVINVVNMILLIYVIIWAIRTNKDLQILKRIFLCSMLLTGVYGLGRYLFFQGDPANYYMNFERTNLRLTYADIGQSMLFCSCLSYALLKLLNKNKNKIQQALYIALTCLCTFNVLFSFRRTAWFGLLLAVVWLILVVDARKKVALIVVLIVGMLFSASFIIGKRFTGATLSRGKLTLTGDITDKKGHFTVEKGRFRELSLAFETFKQHPIFGVGPWAAYTETHGRKDGLEYFTHSSIIHMLFKTGLVGLLLFLSIFLSFTRWWLKNRRRPWDDPDLKMLGDSAFAGFLFEVPDMLFGTPIIIYRHLQLVAFFVALTYLAYSFGTVRKQQDTPRCSTHPPPINTVV
jgi:O-antigen ligase